MPNPSWTDQLTAWSTLAYVVLTAILAVAALAAGVFAAKQLKLVRAEVEQAKQASTAALSDAEAARRASVRPFVVFQKATLLPYEPPLRFVELELQNLGLGVAVDVEVQAWVKAVPPAVLEDRPGKFDPFVRSLDATLLSGPPTAEARMLALGAGAKETVPLVSGLQAALDLENADWAIVFATTRFKDLYETWHYYPPSSGPGKVAHTWRLAQLEQRRPTLR